MKCVGRDMGTFTRHEREKSNEEMLNRVLEQAYQSGADSVELIDTKDWQQDLDLVPHYNTCSLATVGMAGVDALLNTVIIVACCFGLGLTLENVLSLGFAFTIAIALSTGIGDSWHASHENRQREREHRREYSMNTFATSTTPSDLLLNRFLNQGMNIQDAETIVSKLAAYPGIVDSIIGSPSSEQGLARLGDSPWLSGLWMGLVSLTCGVIPLIPLFFGGDFRCSALTSLFALFICGSFPQRQHSSQERSLLLGKRGRRSLKRLMPCNFEAGTFSSGLGIFAAVAALAASILVHLQNEVWGETKCVHIHVKSPQIPIAFLCHLLKGEIASRTLTFEIALLSQLECVPSLR
eukprot:g48822.t1